VEIECLFGAVQFSSTESRNLITEYLSFSHKWLDETFIKTKSKNLTYLRVKCLEGKVNT